MPILKRSSTRRGSGVEFFAAKHTALFNNALHVRWQVARHRPCSLGQRMVLVAGTGPSSTQVWSPEGGSGNGYVACHFWER